MPTTKQKRHARVTTAVSVTALLAVVLLPIAWAVWTTATVDTTGNVGSDTSMKIGNDGFPVISYRDITNSNLKVAKCGNATCSSGNTLTTVDGAINDVYSTSLAIGNDGFPVISYYDVGNEDLKVAKCGNAACSSGNTLTTIDSTGTVGYDTAIAIGGDGFPIIAYLDLTNYNLKVAKCGNADCSSGNTLTTIDSTGDVGNFISIAIGGDGFPVISYHDNTNGDLKVAHCGNAACSSGNTLTTVDSTNFVAFFTSIAIGSDGLPVIGYFDWTNSDLKVAKCGNATCSSGNTITTIDSVGNVGRHPSIAVRSNGLPVISYWDDINLDLEFADCGNAACSSGNTITTIDSVDSVGSDTSIAIGSDGTLIISYYDTTNGDLKVAVLPAPATASTSQGGGGTAAWLIMLRQQNGLDNEGRPLASSSSSSSSVTSSASSSSSSESSSPSSLAPSESAEKPAAPTNTPKEQTPRKKACERLVQRLRDNRSAWQRIVIRLRMRFGQACPS